MSNIVRTNTTMQAERHLVAALQALGFRPEVAADGRNSLLYHGFAGQRERVQVLLPKATLGCSTLADVGFKSTEHGFEQVVDDWDATGRGFGRDWLETVTTEYGVQEAIERAALLGYSLVGREVVTNNGVSEPLLHFAAL